MVKNVIQVVQKCWNKGFAILRVWNSPKLKFLAFKIVEILILDNFEDQILEFRWISDS